MNFPSFKTRSKKLERIDKGEYTSEEYDRWKKEMGFIHGFFGERRAMRRSIVAAIENDPSDDISVLDIGAGTGELTARIRRQFVNKRVFIIGADMSVHSVRSMKENDIVPVMCDALMLPFADNSFDYVFCTLFLHHLHEAAAIELIGQMKRVARNKIFIIDLDRNPFAYYLYRCFGVLFLQPFTREDGALSILRAYTEPELRRMAESAGLQKVEVQRSQINRLILSGI